MVAAEKTADTEEANMRKRSFNVRLRAAVAGSGQGRAWLGGWWRESGFRSRWVALARMNTPPRGYGVNDDLKDLTQDLPSAAHRAVPARGVGRHR